MNKQPFIKSLLADVAARFCTKRDDLDHLTGENLATCIENQDVQNDLESAEWCYEI
jgi:hypothetical protein